LKLAVIIVNYNAGDALLGAVSSAAACSAVDQVIVVDNASCDHSVASLRCPGGFGGKLRVLENPRNMGFAVACNQPLKDLDSSFLLFLNPDCVLTDVALNGLLAVFEDEPRAGMVGPVLRFPDGRMQDGGRRAAPTPWRSFVRASGLYRLSGLFPRLFSDFVLTQDLGNEGVGEVDAISGACMLVRREALNEVGPLDEGYFLHCEDLDWCMRFRQHGWKILFVPHASVVHEKGVCSVSRPVFVAWHKHRGMVRFYRKFYAPTHFVALRALVIVGVWAHFLVKLPLALVRAFK